MAVVLDIAAETQQLAEMLFVSGAPRSSPSPSFPAPTDPPHGAAAWQLLLRQDGYPLEISSGHGVAGADVI